MSTGPEPGGIRAADRVLALGQTGSGKSILLNVLLSQVRCQRFLLDTKDEFSIAGVEPVTRLAGIDWNAPIVHYIDDRGDLRDYDKLFRLLMRRRAGRGNHGTYGLVVCVHELADLCGDAPGATPQWVSAYIRKGRAHGLGLLGGSQRPVNMPKAARTEAQHVFAFSPGFDADDRPIVAKMMRVPESELERLLAEAARLSPTGEHAYLWYDLRAKRIAIRPPLPRHVVAQSIVRGLDDGHESRRATSDTPVDGDEQRTPAPSSGPPEA